MENHIIKLLGALMALIFLLTGLAFFSILYLKEDPQLSRLKRSPEDEPPSKSRDLVIKDGIHHATGLVEGKGLALVVNNCTNCHSAKLITQNKMTRERWLATIRWMQQTQNLWELGENEALILDYLADNYAPEESGRRRNLEEIEWYVLEQNK